MVDGQTYDCRDIQLKMVNEALSVFRQTSDKNYIYDKDGYWMLFDRPDRIDGPVIEMMAWNEHHQRRLFKLETSRSRFIEISDKNFPSLMSPRFYDFVNIKKGTIIEDLHGTKYRILGATQSRGTWAACLNKVDTPTIVCIYRKFQFAGQGHAMGDEELERFYEETMSSV
jgi:hypothetical protein